ncbi:reprolysin-like metallopeptidase [Lysobacter tyrosinilyticus]
MIHSGASTWHPVQISEAHALRAIGEGGMTVRAPDGQTLHLRYERHFEHPDGNWTWVGREEGGAPGTETVLTFGEKAVFGTIRQGNADLSVATEAGSIWLVETDYSRIDRNRLAANDEAFAVPKAGSVPEPLRASSNTVKRLASMPAAAAAVTPTTVDIAMGFTAGFATRLGGESQARTRLNFLVDMTNQAFVASGINAQIRLVRSLQVDYSDLTPARTALFELTGVDCTTQTNGSHYLSDRRVDCTPITRPAGLLPLLAARDRYGADLLVLVRKFEDPEQVSCGSAWMLGGGQTPLDASSADFGMAMVSDSSGDMFPDNGNTCSELQLAHELGHDFGQQHDVVNAAGDDDSDNNGSLLDPEEFGHHPYSFSYSTDGTGADISTIMSNRRPSQTRYRVYANPLITACGGAPCGDAATADNARSMTQTMPVVAQFRATVPGEQNLDLYAIYKTGLSGMTEVHVADQFQGYQSFLLHQATILHQTGSDYAWRFQLADYNGDGVLDLYAIFRMGASGTTEVHVLNGADYFRSFLLNTATALFPTGSDNGWIFRVGDYNRDGRPDIYVIARSGATGTEVHVLNGADNFGSWLAHIATPLPQSGTDGRWDFLLGDNNHDGILDLYVILRSATGSGKTEVHVADGATNFNTFPVHAATALPTTGVNNDWNFKLGDNNGDGVLDLIVIFKNGGSGKTEVHVADGASGFQLFPVHVATAVPSSGSDDAWEFELGGFR